MGVRAEVGVVLVVESVCDMNLVAVDKMFTIPFAGVWEESRARKSESRKEHKIGSRKRISAEANRWVSNQKCSRMVDHLCSSVSCDRENEYPDRRLWKNEEMENCDDTSNIQTQEEICWKLTQTMRREVLVQGRIVRSSSFPVLQRLQLDGSVMTNLWLWQKSCNIQWNERAQRGDGTDPY